MITELRRYRIKPDRLESWLRFFEEATRETARHGIRVEYVGLDRETATFCWLRSFDDEADRVRSKVAFYGSEWWTKREAFAMDHVVEYEVSFLEAAWVRRGGELEAEPLPAPGGRPGRTPDDPPGGWVRSTRAAFVPDGGPF